MNEGSNNKDVLIVGLGNPGLQYARTRHNLGFIVVQNLAKKWGFSFKKALKFEGELAVGQIEGREGNIYLLLPMTYMNLSGRAVIKALRYYKIPPSSTNSFLVVVDDVYLKFGTMRLRVKGSTGGHNGLKSLQEYLQSDEYCRLRMGIGAKGEALPEGERFFLEDYVLGKFTQEEQNDLPDFATQGVEAIECWLKEGAEAAVKHIGRFTGEKA